jgi:predicted phosphoribosyltransferase
VHQSELDEIIAEETERLHSYKERFHGEGEQALAGKNVIIVDDGLATGATAEAAVMSARKQHARRIIMAVPVSSPDAADRLSAAADELVTMTIDPEFVAVGQYYQYFPQTTDEEVQTLLHPAHA